MGKTFDDSTLSSPIEFSVIRKRSDIVRASGSASDHHLNEQILLAKSDTRGIPAHIPILYFYPWSEKFVSAQPGVRMHPTFSHTVWKKSWPVETAGYAGIYYLAIRLLFTSSRQHCPQHCSSYRQCCRYEYSA